MWRDSTRPHIVRVRAACSATWALDVALLARTDPHARIRVLASVSVVDCEPPAADDLRAPLPERHPALAPTRIRASHQGPDLKFTA
jgi:hypothetical protein